MIVSSKKRFKQKGMKQLRTDMERLLQELRSDDFKTPKDMPRFVEICKHALLSLFAIVGLQQDEIDDLRSKTD